MLFWWEKVNSTEQPISVVEKILEAVEDMPPGEAARLLISMAQWLPGFMMEKEIARRSLTRDCPLKNCPCQNKNG